MSRTSPFLKLTGKQHQSATHSLICRTRLRPECTAEDHGPLWWWPRISQDGMQWYTVLPFHTKHPPVASVLGNQSARGLTFSTDTIMGCFKAEAFLLRLNTSNYCCTQGNAIFDHHLLVCKHHLKRDATHSSAPVLSFPQVRSLACPHGREARWPTSAATPWWSRALTCPRQTWLNSWGETAATQQTSAGLCGTGLHPGSTRYSESGLRRINEMFHRQLLHNCSFTLVPGELTISVLIMDA